MIDSGAGRWEQGAVGEGAQHAVESVNLDGDRRLPHVGRSGPAFGSAAVGILCSVRRRENIEEPEDVTAAGDRARCYALGDLGLLLVSEFSQPGIVALGAANGAVSDWSMKTVHTLMNSISRSQPLLSAAYVATAGNARSTPAGTRHGMCGPAARFLPTRS